MGLDYGINNNLGKISFKESQKILSYAFTNGIRDIDCAESYGDAHKVIGLFHKKNQKKQFKIHTKISNFNINNFEDKISDFKESLFTKNLNTLMFHSFDLYEKNLKKIDKFLKLKKDGVIKNIGVSTYTNHEIKNIIKDVRIDVIQLPFNLLDNSREKINLIKKAKKKGKIIQARSVFLQGLFFKDYNRNNVIVDKLKDELKEINIISLKNNIPIFSLALNYVSNKEYIDNVIIGVDGINQLKQNIRSINKDINQDIVKSLERIETKNIDFLNPITWLKYGNEE